MKINVKTIGYVIGVDCAGLPVVVNHYVEQAEGEMSYDVNSAQADSKFAKKCSLSLSANPSTQDVIADSRRKISALITSNFKKISPISKTGDIFYSI